MLGEVVYCKPPLNGIPNGFGFIIVWPPVPAPTPKIIPPAPSPGLSPSIEGLGNV